RVLHWPRVRDRSPLRRRVVRPRGVAAATCCAKRRRANAAAKSRGWPGTPAPCPRGSVPASPAGPGALAVHTPGRRPTVPHRRAGRVRVVEGTAQGRARTAPGTPTPDWRLHAAVGSPTCTDEHAG